MARIRVWPAPGLTVPNPPDGEFFGPEGTDVEHDFYIIRRLREGSLLTERPDYGETAVDEPEPVQAPERPEPAKVAETALSRFRGGGRRRKADAAPEPATPTDTSTETPDTTTSDAGE